MLAESHVWKIPGGPVVEFLATSAVAIAVGARHGPLAACAAGAAVIALTELAARRPTWALGLLVVAYAALPRIDAQLRTEDFVTVGLVLAALRRRRPFDSPIDTPLAVWILAIGLSLSVGLLMGTIARPAIAAFTALKMVEYLIAFYAAWLLRAEIRYAFAISLCILAVVGMLSGGPRPFDSGLYKAEANHVGGFAVLCAALAFGRRWWPLLAVAVGVAALSQSRGALLALGVVCLLQLFSPGRRIAAVLVLAAGVAAALGPLRERVRSSPVEWETYRRTEMRVSEGYPPVYSHTRNRFEMWSLLAEDFAKYPIAGTGPGSRDKVVYENAYVMVACEAGAIGVFAFLFVIVAILARRDWTAASATVAMLVLGLTSISFFLAREAGPWWILVGTALSGRLNGADQSADRARREAGPPHAQPA